MNPHPNLSSFSALFVLMLSQPLVSHSTYYPGTAFSPNFYYIRSLEQRLKALEQTVNNEFPRLGDLEMVVTDLGRQECQTGDVAIRSCPGLGETSSDNILACVTAPTNGSDPVNLNFPVTFSPAFMNPPVVDLSFSGVSVFTGKNCSAQLIAVSNEGFTFNYLADDFLPVGVDLTWYACPSALFDANQGLPDDGSVFPHGPVVAHSALG